MEKGKEIRFIDSHYNTLFKIPNGSYITIVGADGRKSTYKCRYIDGYHLYVGNYGYHICEFAERMERNGSSCRPAGEMEIFLTELENGSAYDYMCSRGHNLSKTETINILKEYIYASRGVGNINTEAEFNKGVLENIKELYCEDGM